MLKKELIEKLEEIYSDDPVELERQTNRYTELSKKHKAYFGKSSDLYYFSSPGRTELGGNHTDHNNGKVIAASINRDAIAVVTKEGSDIVTIYSEEYKDKIEVDLNELVKRTDETGTTKALVKGIAFSLKERGYKVGGFNCTIQSNVLVGSGLSSSACIEVLIGSIFNCLYNDGEITAEEIAEIGQYAEQIYFGKPCGRMDQLACAIGGVIAIDFKDKSKPAIRKLSVDLEDYNYKLIILNTGSSHNDLTSDYAAVPEEMKRVANYFGKETLRDVSRSDLLLSLKELRNAVDDRAILRALHFFSENDRVDQQLKALGEKKIERFIELVRESGDSSSKFLQNIYSNKNVNSQSITLAIALTEEFIKSFGAGACRIHGGGFAGTIQVFLPEDLVAEYIGFMSNIIDEESIHVLKFREMGATYIGHQRNGEQSLV